MLFLVIFFPDVYCIFYWMEKLKRNASSMLEHLRNTSKCLFNLWIYTLYLSSNITRFSSESPVAFNTKWFRVIRSSFSSFRSKYTLKVYVICVFAFLFFSVFFSGDKGQNKYEKIDRLSHDMPKWEHVFFIDVNNARIPSTEKSQHLCFVEHHENLRFTGGWVSEWMSVFFPIVNQLCYVQWNIEKQQFCFVMRKCCFLPS